MKSLFKIAVVVTGYLAAFLLAAIVSYIYVTVADSQDRHASSGMTAFGDSLLFIAVFGLASIPATCAALFFLRAHTTFWRILSVGCSSIVVTGILALPAFIFYFNATSGFYTWSAHSPIRLLLAPLFAIAFFLCALFAPIRVYRNLFLSAMAIETVAFVIWVGYIYRCT